MGVVDLLVESEQKLNSTTFHVINSESSNLLNGTSALALNLLSIPNNNNFKQIKQLRQSNNEPTHAEQQQIPIRLQPMVDYYKPTLFSGKIGKFKNINIKFHIDDSVPPVAQPERRIPFALREKVQAEIDKLEKTRYHRRYNQISYTMVKPISNHAKRKKRNPGMPRHAERQQSHL